MAGQEVEPDLETTLDIFASPETDSEGKPTGKEHPRMEADSSTDDLVLPTRESIIRTPKKVTQSEKRERQNTSGIIFSPEPTKESRPVPNDTKRYIPKGCVPRESANVTAPTSYTSLRNITKEEIPADVKGTKKLEECQMLNEERVVFKPEYAIVHQEEGSYYWLWPATSSAEKGDQAFVDGERDHYFGPTTDDNVMASTFAANSKVFLNIPQYNVCTATAFVTDDPPLLVKGKHYQKVEVEDWPQNCSFDDLEEIGCCYWPVEYLIEVHDFSRDQSELYEEPKNVTKAWKASDFEQKSYKSCAFPYKGCYYMFTGLNQEETYVMGEKCDKWSGEPLVRAGQAILARFDNMEPKSREIDRRLKTLNTMLKTKVLFENEEQRKKAVQQGKRNKANIEAQTAASSHAIKKQLRLEQLHQASMKDKGILKRATIGDRQYTYPRADLKATLEYGRDKAIMRRSNELADVSDGSANEPLVKDTRRKRNRRCNAKAENSSAAPSETGLLARSKLQMKTSLGGRRTGDTGEKLNSAVNEPEEEPREEESGDNTSGGASGGAIAEPETYTDLGAANRRIKDLTIQVAISRTHNEQLMKRANEEGISRNVELDAIVSGLKCNKNKLSQLAADMKEDRESDISSKETLSSSVALAKSILESVEDESPENESEKKVIERFVLLVERGTKRTTAPEDIEVGEEERQYQQFVFCENKEGDIEANSVTIPWEEIERLGLRVVRVSRAYQLPDQVEQRTENIDEEEEESVTETPKRVLNIDAEGKNVDKIDPIGQTAGLASASASASGSRDGEIVAGYSAVSPVREKKVSEQVEEEEKMELASASASGSRDGEIGAGDSAVSPVREKKVSEQVEEEEKMEETEKDEEKLAANQGEQHQDSDRDSSCVSGSSHSDPGSDSDDEDEVIPMRKLTVRLSRSITRDMIIDCTEPYTLFASSHWDCWLPGKKFNKEARAGALKLWNLYNVTGAKLEFKEAEVTALKSDRPSGKYTEADKEHVFWNGTLVLHRVLECSQARGKLITLKDELEAIRFATFKKPDFNWLRMTNTELVQDVLQKFKDVLKEDDTLLDKCTLTMFYKGSGPQVILKSIEEARALCTPSRRRTGSPFPRHRPIAETNESAAEKRKAAKRHSNPPIAEQPEKKAKVDNEPQSPRQLEMERLVKPGANVISTERQFLSSEDVEGQRPEICGPTSDPNLKDWKPSLKAPSTSKRAGKTVEEKKTSQSKEAVPHGPENKPHTPKTTTEVPKKVDQTHEKSEPPAKSEDAPEKRPKRKVTTEASEKPAPPAKKVDFEKPSELPATKPTTKAVPPGGRKSWFASPPVWQPSLPSVPPAVPSVPPAVPSQPPAVPSMPPAVPSQPPAVPSMPPAVPSVPPAVPSQPPAVPSQPPAVPSVPPAKRMSVMANTETPKEPATSPVRAKHSKSDDTNVKQAEKEGAKAAGDETREKEGKSVESAQIDSYTSLYDKVRSRALSALDEGLRKGIKGAHGQLNIVFRELLQLLLREDLTEGYDVHIEDAEDLRKSIQLLWTLMAGKPKDMLQGLEGKKDPEQAVGLLEALCGKLENWGNRIECDMIEKLLENPKFDKTNVWRAREQFGTAWGLKPVTKWGEKTGLLFYEWPTLCKMLKMLQDGVQQIDKDGYVLAYMPEPDKEPEKEPDPDLDFSSADHMDDDESDDD